VTGLAGATTAAAEAVEGVYNNAAAPAVREPFSLKWFDYDLSFAISFPGAYGGTDFNNRGAKGNPSSIERTDRFLYYNLGAQLQFGGLGFTLMGDFLTYDVSSGSQSTGSLDLTLGRIHAVAGYGLLGNQVVVGAGARIVYVNIREKVADGAVISMVGAAPQVGVVVKPDDVPFRLGATARAPVTASAIEAGTTVIDPATKVRHAGGFITPDRITQPWEVEAGVAYQLGPRPLNPPWINPREQESAEEERVARQRADRDAARRAEIASFPPSMSDDERARRIDTLAREEAEARAAEDAELAGVKERLLEERKARYLNWPRERLLLLASVLLAGPSEDAVALEGFMDQRRELVGRSVSIAPRFAAESEPLPNLMRLRAGVYLEPSRFDDGTARQHFTFGGDLRIFSWDLFGIVPMTTLKLAAFLDVAPRYQNFGFAIGTWH
jgi:hypothetical protein